MSNLANCSNIFQVVQILRKVPLLQAMMSLGGFLEGGFLLGPNFWMGGSGPLRWTFTGTKSLVRAIKFLLYSINGPDECALLCENTDQCAGWTQKLSNNLCYLKTSLDHKNDHPEWIHGPPCSGLLIMSYMSFISGAKAPKTAGTTTNLDSLDTRGEPSLANQTESSPGRLCVQFSFHSGNVLSPAFLCF